MLRTPIIILPVLVSSFHFCPDTSVADVPQLDPMYENDYYPQALGDRVTPPTHTTVDFYYLSDVEDPRKPTHAGAQDSSTKVGAAQSRPWIVTWVRNVHTQPLTFTWDAYPMYQHSSKLPSGLPDRYSFGVCDYYVNPNAQIKFTHRGRPLIAPAYTGRIPNGALGCEAEEESAISSEIQIGYLKKDDEVIQIDIGVTVSFDGYDITYEIDNRQKDIIVGLSGLTTAIKSLKKSEVSEELFTHIREQLEPSDTKVRVVALADHLATDEADDLPSAVKNTDLLLLSSNVAEGSSSTAENATSIEFTVPTKEFETVFQTIERVVLFDPEGNLISIGPVALYLPIAKLEGGSE
jgi:hypothetical protein